MKKIMFVCDGNTCRSAMAETILKSVAKQNNDASIKATSAGLCVTENKMHPYARLALKELGYSPKKFVPKAVTKELVKKQNAVICMTKEQKARFCGFMNIYTISELTGLPDVPDPYGSGEIGYIRCCADIEKAVEIIYKLIVEDEE
ncbi:MAG: hypothetical protein ACI4M6_02310 [Christensenellaceae bacterium]